jgi:hypothetical protein
MRIWTLLLGVLLVLGASACGGNRDKGINKDRDKPQQQK